MTLEEYLAYENGTDISYELVNGELAEMPPESIKNLQIVFYLITQFLQVVPANRLANKVEIITLGNRATARIPDLLVLTDDLIRALQASSRATITLDMPVPLLVIEVVSPGTVNENRDYRYKRSEYGARGIPEYWIVDPIREKVLVLTLVEGFYEEAEFRGRDRVESSTFPNLQLIAEVVLSAGNVN